MRLTIKGGLQSRAANNRVNTVFHTDFFLPFMGGGTFFKVGGNKCMPKNYREFLRLKVATVMSQALKYDAIIYTPYVGLNYTILDEITPLLLQLTASP